MLLGKMSSEEKKEEKFKNFGKAKPQVTSNKANSIIFHILY